MRNGNQHACLAKLKTAKDKLEQLSHSRSYKIIVITWSSYSTWKNFVSGKTVYAFLSLISRLPIYPRSNGWTFFYSPLNVAFKNVFDFVIWLILVLVIVELEQETKIRINMYDHMNYIYKFSALGWNYAL